MNNQTPLSPMQKAYLLGKSKMFPLSQSSMHDFREFQGHLDAEVLAQRLATLIQHYPALRTLVDETQLSQQIQSNIALHHQFEVYDYRDLNPAEAMLQLEKRRAQYRNFAHDLTLNIPPWRIVLIQLPTQMEIASVVLCSFDGLIIDGYSLSVILDLLFDFNHSLSDLPKAAVTATSPDNESFYAANQKDQQFWQDKLAEVEEVAQFPWKNSLDSITDPHYARLSVTISKAQFDQLSQLAIQHKIFANALLTTVLLEELSRWTEEQRILLSMPISNSALHKTVGNSSSFIVLDYQFNPKLCLVDQVKVTQKQILEAMTHTSYSGIELSKYLIKKLQQSIVLPVALTNGLSWVKPSEHAQARYVAGQTQTPQLALDIRLSYSAQSDLVIDLDFIEEALSTRMVQEMADALEARLTDITQLKIALAQSQRQSNVQKLNDDLKIVDEYQHIDVVDYLAKIQHHLFEQTPDKTALIYDGQHISYVALATNVAKVRRALDLAQINQNQVVAICLTKSPEHIYAILACALSGIVWLPVDMDSPKLRQQYILSNSRADLAISTAPIDDLLTLNINEILKDSSINSYSGSAECIFEPEISWQHRHDTSPAYYLYTSGSTGTPKCVVLNNRATAHVLQQTIQFWQINQHDVHFAATPFHHDMALFDVMAPLSVAATLVIPTLEQAKSAVAWAELIERYQVSIWCTVPAMADMLLTSAHAQQLQSIRLINQGGDYVKPSVVQKLREILPNARLISIGGPTETTIWSIWHEITAEDQQLIPYGRAMSHNHYYILNQFAEFCPVGVVGQLYMSGINLANGYLVDGKITQHDFVQLTLANGEVHRAFRMSDKGYLREDGNIIFAGRDEGYLKVRGVRIAASEIENALLKHPQITDCMVTTCSNPIYEGNELVAVYTTVVSPHNTLRPAELRQFLQAHVPNSHIPTRWIAVADFPMTRNGKIDRKQLKQTAQDVLNQNYADMTHAKQQQNKSEQAVPIQSVTATGPASIAQEVIRYFHDALADQVDNNDVFLDTEILALGIGSSYLNGLSKHFAQQLKTSIQCADLVKCKTIGEIVNNIESQLQQK
ncbi:AMP-binding protein [Acinetobacter rudis]|uniref:AMP-binding protein n=1 Tax=Acinetobacter rudis TaxID=632955 RepID=UPI003341D818